MTAGLLNPISPKNAIILVLQFDVFCRIPVLVGIRVCSKTRNDGNATIIVFLLRFYFFIFMSVLYQ